MSHLSLTGEVRANLHYKIYVEEGYIDSLGLIQFIAVIEDEFGITFTDEDLGSEDIKVVGKMAELIASKMEGAAE